MSILVIDDDDHILTLLGLILKRLNLEIIFRNSAVTAYSECLHRSVTLILVDDMLPGMNGYQYAQLVVNDQAVKKIPGLILLESAPTTVDTSDFNAIITKPFTSSQVLREIDALLPTPS